MEGLNIPSVQPVLLYGVAFAHLSDEDLRRIINRSMTFVCRGKKVRDYVHGCWGVPLDRIAMKCHRTRSGDKRRANEKPGSPPTRRYRPRRGCGGGGHLRARFTIGKALTYGSRQRRSCVPAIPVKKLKFMWIGGSEGQRTLTLYGSAVTSHGSGIRLSGRSFFLPATSNYVYPYLDLCDIYVQPSRDDPFPHATLEAMAMAKPVVSFPEGVGGEPYAREALVRVGFSAEALADGVASLIDAPDLRRS